MQIVQWLILVQLMQLGIAALQLTHLFLLRTISGLPEQETAIVAEAGGAVSHKRRAQLALMRARVDPIGIIDAAGAGGLIVAGQAERHKGRAESALCQVIKAVVLFASATGSNVGAGLAVA